VRSLPEGKSKIQNLLEPLTPREHQVLRLMAAGLSNPEIAETLIVSLNTIKTQVKSIYRKLDVHTRDDACDLARRLKLL
jgi:LuxR family maltose regulon positive regulatory protein